MKIQLLLNLVLAFTLRAAPPASPAMPGVVYGENGNQQQQLDVYFPRDHTPGKSAALPAVLCIHGGAWRAGTRTDMAPFASEFARSGYVAVTMSYRLFDSAKHPENIWPAQYDDAQQAVRWMRANREKLGILPDKIAAAGASAGGHLVALLGTTDTRSGGPKEYADQSSRVNAVINVFGPADLTKDFTKYFIGPVSVQTLVDDFIGNKLPAAESTKAKQEASPITHIDTKTVPFLIFHGDKDSIVPVEQSRQFHEALTKGGRDSTYVELKGEGHGLGAPGSMDKFRSSTQTFLERTLGKPAAVSRDK